MTLTLGNSLYFIYIPLYHSKQGNQEMCTIMTIPDIFNNMLLVNFFISYVLV